MTLGRERILIPGFIRSRPTLAVYDVAYFLPLGGVCHLYVILLAIGLYLNYFVSLSENFVAVDVLVDVLPLVEVKS